MDSYAETWDALSSGGLHSLADRDVFAALMAAFVTDGCRGFSGAGPLSFGGYPQMKSVTLVSHLYSHRKKVTTPIADAGGFTVFSTVES